MCQEDRRQELDLPRGCMGSQDGRFPGFRRVDPDQCQQGDIEAASNTLSALVDIYYVQIAQGDFEELFNSELANIRKDQ